MSLRRRRLTEKCFKIATALITWSSIAILGVLVFQILKEGMQWVDWQFITSLPSRKAEKAGIYTAIWGSFYLMITTMLFALPTGIGAAIFLEEYGGKSRLSRFIDVNVANLAGVPSIVYGLLGLAVFVNLFGFGRSVISGGLTLGLLVLPVIIITTRGAIRSVPKSIPQAAYALGAKKWQVIFFHTLPYALPGILTGVILSVSRAIGETAPLIIVGAAAYVAFVPESLLDEFTALPIQIFNWTSRPQEVFHSLSAGGIIILLSVMLTMNSVAIFFRHKTQRSRNG
ncbi:MAG: phosphate ABC transporter, permease protein PstA [Bacteriovorax sp. MedPE-SWde]|nr:MAG: phosphate ABC transporter, permease protein PstA [Bacteriovorax sp. MedPE-SWde]